MIAGRCLTEMLFPISRMVACRKIILFGRIVGRRISAIRREWNVETRASYAGGELSGMYEAYNGDGSCRMVEYRAGLPVHDYYLLADGSGNTLKFRIADDMPVWESPVITERSVDYRDGVPWEVYFKTD